MIKTQISQISFLFRRCLRSADKSPTQWLEIFLFFIRYFFKSAERISVPIKIFPIFFSLIRPQFIPLDLIWIILGQNVNFWVSIPFYWKSFYIGHNVFVYD